MLECEYFSDMRICQILCSNHQKVGNPKRVGKVASLFKSFVNFIIIHTDHLSNDVTKRPRPYLYSVLGSVDPLVT